MKNAALIILALLLQMTAKTQVTFEKIITKGSIETGWSVIQTSDGGYAFLCSLGASLSSDRWLVKTDYLGDTVRTRTFPGIGYENGDRSLVQAADGGYTFIANRSGKADLLHVSSSGDSLWEKELFSGIKIEVKKFAVKIPAMYTGKIYSMIQGTKKEKEEWLEDGGMKITVEIPAGIQMEFFDKINSLTHGSAIVEEIKK